MSRLTGCLVLSHDINLSCQPLLDTLFSGFSESLEGNDRKGADTLTTGYYRVASDQVCSIESPSRNCVVSNYMVGSVTNSEEISSFLDMVNPAQEEEGYAAVKLLMRLNSVRLEDGLEPKNYAELVKHRVLDRMTGKWSSCLCYLSDKTKFILSSKGIDIYIYVIHQGRNFILVWTNEETQFERIEKSLTDEQKENLFCYNMTPMVGKNLLILTPLYLISKWHKWRQRSMESKRKDKYLVMLALLEKYLNRTAL